MIGEEADKRSEGATSAILGTVELEDPSDDVAHRVPLGVGGGPEHGGDELLGLAPPESIVGPLVAACSGQHLGGRERVREVGRTPERTPSRRGPAGHTERIEDLDVAAP